MKIREKIITRTVNTLWVDVIGFDSDDNPCARSFEIPDIEEKKIIPFLAEKCAGDFIPAKVKAVLKVETLYGMPESVFIVNAQKLPPRTTTKEQG